MLIQAIHACAVKYPSVASNVVLALMDFLGDNNIPTAVEVVTFVREVAQTYPELRESILRKLTSSIKQITASSVRFAKSYEYRVSTKVYPTTSGLPNSTVGVGRILRHRR